MPRNNQRTDVSRQELQRLEARLTSLAGRTARQASDSDELPVDAVDTVNIANDAVTEDKIADGAVTFKKLASGGTTSGGGGNYSSQAETQRSGATDTVEVYYTARPDGDGYAESEVTTSTPAGFVIERKLYFSDKFNADPDTAADWTLYTTQPADNTAFATARASLLAGLSDTDGTANTRGTLPVSLKMTHRFAQDLLLEDFPGAAGGYSLRKISSDYTGSAIRIREDSGNTETDIGFDSNGNLDTAAIASHCGSANGYVVTWYDQSGNGNDATQSTTTRQPQIYDGSSVITHNGHPAIDGNGSSSLPTGRNYSATFSAYIAAHAPSDATGLIYAGANERGTATIINFGTAYWLQIFSGTGLLYQAAGNAPSHNLLSTVHNGTSSSIHNLGTLRASGNSGTDSPINMSLFGRDLYAPKTTCSVHEIIFYESDHSANRTGVESNINTYYKPATALLLDTYGGAAAAYSVRKLSQWYTGSCMRIREDSGDTETDIGFDSNGDLDTAAIASHCGSANGYVVTWYDQSGNAYDATRTTASEQPRIYDGASVLTLNGKPCIDLYHPFTYFGLSASGLPAISCNNLSFFYVAQDTQPSTTFRRLYYYGNSQALEQSGGTYYFRQGSWTAAASQDSSQHLFEQHGTSTALSGYVDGTQYSLGFSSAASASPSQLDIGKGSTNSNAWQGTIQEFIVYAADNISNRTGINSNINTYFSIYP